jgi:hypothetical protein
MDFEFLKDRRTVIGLGGAVAVLLGVGLAVAVLSGDKSDEPPPASRSGLVVEVGREDDGKLDPARPLRCFVGGAFVGEITLAECARKNGVATGALDVGVDETGALAAADVAGTVLTPLPPEPEAAAPATGIAAPSAPTAPPVVAMPASGPSSACWRYQGAEWRRLPGDLTVNACLQTLFAGRCERPGGATYGRWGDQTLRLVPGRVEASMDNRSFQTLVEQTPACAIPPVG